MGSSYGSSDEVYQAQLAQNVPEKLIDGARSINVQDPSINVLAQPSRQAPQLLCASSTPTSVELLNTDGFRKDTFDSHRHRIHALFRSGPDWTLSHESFLAVDSDRFINISDLSTKKLLRTLVTSGEVQSASFLAPDTDDKDSSSQQLLAVLRKDGLIEMFSQPFEEAAGSQVNGDVPSKRKNVTRKANATIRIVSSQPKGSVSVFDASVQGAEIHAAIVEGGIDVAFQRVRWQDEGTGELLFEGTKDVVYTRPSSTLNSVATNGVKDMSRAQLDESTAIVGDSGAQGTTQTVAIAISSSESGIESDDSEDLDSDQGQKANIRRTLDTESAAFSEDESRYESESSTDAELREPIEQTASAIAEQQDVAMNEAEHASAAEVDDEPTFGELVAAQNGALISVADNLPFDHTSSTVQASRGAPLPAGMSLTTVLSQSLRTNDTNLLESCLHTASADIIQATVQRLESSLAGILLQKLAERLSSRPGRYGHLITWVQSTCVIHGGSLANQPAAVEKMKTLYRVLNQRSRCLGDLLMLKGKLDMLDQQLQYRKFLAAQRAEARPQDENGMIMIEGQDNWTSTDEDGDNSGVRSNRREKKTRRRDLNDVISNDSDEVADEDVQISDEDDKEPDTLPNGVAHSSDDD